MTPEITIAVIGMLGSASGSLVGLIVSSKLINYRIEQLEKKVEKHNNLVERVYKLEQDEAVTCEKIAVANHRINDLESIRQ